ncbi:MAG: hypothetical protein ACYC7E_07665 [Armatimonadota bacterium]
MRRCVRRDLLRAAAGDWMTRLATLPEVDVWISCGREWGDMACLGLRRWREPLRLAKAMGEETPRLYIALDAPTVPSGYVKTAIEQLRNGGCERVVGPLHEKGWYLQGFGIGVGAVTLPEWYRILLPGGMKQARLDMLRGCAAPETAAALRLMT